MIVIFFTKKVPRADISCIIYTTGDKTPLNSLSRENMYMCLYCRNIVNKILLRAWRSPLQSFSDHLTILKSRKPNKETTAFNLTIRSI